MSAVATQELARARAARIRAGIGAYLATLADIAAAYAQQDWRALGYADWQAYVDGEYSEHRLKLSTEHRQKAVAELRLAGMSQRAVGTALGVSQDTVRRDLDEVNDSVHLPEIQGADGKTYASTRPTNSTSSPADAPKADRLGSVSGEAESGQQNPSQSDLLNSDTEVTSAETEWAPANGVDLAVGISTGSHPAASSVSEGSATLPSVAAALDHFAPDAEGPHREWRRNFLAAINGAYRPISRSTVQEVVERADDECVAELVRVAAELTSFADRVRTARAANRPKNVLTLVRPA